MTSRRVRYLSAVALAAGLASVPALSIRCSDQAARDAAVDAAVERRVRDRTGPDNEVVEPDASDAGWVCSPPPGDDGFVHDWPGWRRTSEFDKCCPIDMREDLTKAVPYNWVSCGAGCLMFNAPTSDISGIYPALVGRTVRGKGGQATQFILTRNELADNSYEQTYYDLTSGTPLFSLREADNPHCFGAIVAETDDSALLWHVLYAVPAAPTSGILVASGPMATVSQWPDAGHMTGLSDNIVAALYSGGRGAFGYLGGGIATCNMHSPGNPICIVANVASVAPAYLNLYPEYFIEGDYIYAPSGLGSAGWAEVYIVGPAGDVRLLRGLPKTHICAITSDGKSLTWLQVQGDIIQTNPQTSGEIWTAPLTGDPVQLASTAKKIATLPRALISGDAYSSNGYYAVYLGLDVYIVRISDGVFIKSPAPPAPFDKYPAGTFYITDTEIWMASGANIADQLFRLTLPPWP